MANPEHVKAVENGSKNLARADLVGANLVGADLEGADLAGAKLEGANLASAKLLMANLVGADLRRANLRGADLERADLTGAILEATNLEKANLDGTNLLEANLLEANLLEANLTGATLKDTAVDYAAIGGTKFIALDLRQLEGVDVTNHLYPSTIDTSTFRKTAGEIDLALETFLRYCGLDQWEIEFLKLYDQALAPEQISDHLYRNVFDKRTPGSIYLGGVFISYSHANVKFVEELYNAIKRKDITVYLDRHDFTAGSIEKNISRAIRINDQVVLVLSKDSLESDWVWDEITLTLEKEKELGKDVLFPISVDDSWHTNPRNKRRLMRQIKERVILDFSKSNDFETNLQKLITGMKVNQ